MTDRTKKFTDEFIGLYQENSLLMFRFHLARSGDWSQAQALTKATFEAALRWFIPDRLKLGERRAWLFKIGAAIRAVHIETGGDDVLPTQAQMAQFARVSRLHEQWKRMQLGRKQSDALLLSIFAQLKLDEISRILGIKEQTIAGWLSNLPGDLPSETTSSLHALAEGIEPVGFFLGGLENALREQSGHRKPPRGVQFGWAKLRFSYLAGPGLTVLGQALPVVLLMGGLIWGMQSFIHLQPEQKTDGLVRNKASELIATASNQAIDVGSFPPSMDSVVLVDSKGALFSLSLVDGTRQIIVPSGTYKPGKDALGFAPTVSPNRHWLSVARVQSRGTWLYALDGSKQIQISSSPVQLTWSPDGNRAAFTNPDTGSEILFYDVIETRQHSLIRLDGNIVAMTWSPDGKSIAAEINIPESQAGSNANTVIAKVGTVTIENPHWQELYSVGGQPDRPVIEPMLMWTVDGDELWMTQFMAAVWMNDLSVHALSQQPFSDPYGVRSLLFGNPKGVSAAYEQVALSPDRVKLATLSDHTDGTPGVVSVQLDENTGQLLWIKNFGSVASLAWTGEGLNLILAEKQDEPGNLFRVDAMDGKSQVIATRVQMLGTQLGLLNAALNRAPKVALRHITATEDDHAWIVQQTVPLEGVYYRFPMDWKVWRPSSLDQHVGTVVMTNFDYVSPFGYASIGDNDISIWVMANTSGDRITKDYVEYYTRAAEPGTFRYEPVIVDGAEGYRLFYSSPRRSLVTEVVAIPFGGIEIDFTMVPYTPEQGAVFDKMLQSVRLTRIETNGNQILTPKN